MSQLHDEYPILGIIIFRVFGLILDYVVDFLLLFNVLFWFHSKMAKTIDVFFKEIVLHNWQMHCHVGINIWSKMFLTTTPLAKVYVRVRISIWLSCL
jgi:hypothetical protein